MLLGAASRSSDAFDAGPSGTNPGFLGVNQSLRVRLSKVDPPDTEGSGASAPDAQGALAAAAGKRLRIVTRCGSLDEFFGTFGAFADESSLFIVTNKPRALGLKQSFVIQLANGDTIMRGDVEVIESITDGKGPDGRNGMRLKLLTVDDATRDVQRQLLEYGKNKPTLAQPPTNDAAPESSAVASEARPGLSAEPGPAPARPAAPPGGPPPKPAAAPRAPPAKTAGDKAAARPPEAGERAPGASYQLPANPFAGISAEALESFVECTLYEDRVPRGSSVASSLDDPSNRAGPQPPAGLAGAPVFGAPPAGAPLAPPTFSAAPLPPTFVPPPPAMGANAIVAAAIQTGNVPAARLERRPWIVGISITAVVSSVASLVTAYFVWGRSPEGPPPAVSGATSSAAQSASDAPTPRTGAPIPTATGAPTPSASASSTAPAGPSPPRDCRANVRSFPLGANVQWNGEALGITPLNEAAVPCGPAKIAFALSGFEPGERTATAILGKNAGVFLRLLPVLVPVEVTSAPPGARILVDGRAVGTTPANVAIAGQREATVMLTHPRYKTWTRRLVPEPPRVTLHAELERR